MNLLALSSLSDDELRLIDAHLDRLYAHRRSNELSEAYYRGTQRVRQLGIALPDHVADKIETVVGWPEIGVNTLDERLDLDGFVLPDADLGSLGLADVLAANEYFAEAVPAGLDTLIYGLNFAAVSDGGDGEPHPLVTWEPPTRMTAAWDGRRRRLSSACSFLFSDLDGRLERATLFLPDETVIADRVDDRWVVRDRQSHRYGEVPVVRFVTRPRSGRPWGSSEITPAWRSLTDSAVRTLLGMEVSREFYSSPQRYALNVSEDAFTDSDGKPVPAWEALLGRVWALDGGEDGAEAKVGQFNAASPAPYIEQLRGLSWMFGGAAALPPSTLGFHTDNPPSGDSQRMYEARLVKRAERQQAVTGPSHARVARLILRRLHGDDLPNLTRLSARWRDAATPTKASTADQVAKYVAAGILPAQSEVTWEMMGLDATTRGRLADDLRRDRADARIAALRGAAAAVTDETAIDLASRRGDPDAGD